MNAEHGVELEDLDWPLYSIAIQAHESRRPYAEELAAVLGNAPIAWSRTEGDVWDTHRRARELCDPVAMWSVVIQDDAELLPGFHHRLTDVLYEQPLSFVGLYFRAKRSLPMMSHMARVGRARGGFAFPRFQWALASAIRSIVLPDLLSDCDRMNDISPARDDDRIRRWALERSMQTWYPLPSLVDHRPGIQSLVGNGPNARRRATYR
jgi:hypothetical protein